MKRLATWGHAPHRSLRVFCFLVLALGFLSLTAPPASASVDARLLAAQGIQSYLHSQYPRARDLLAQAAILDPQDPGVQFSLGLSYLALKDYRTAQKAFSLAVSFDPHYPQGHLYLGICHYLLGEYEQAQAVLTRARQEDPTEGLTRYYLGLCAIQLERPREAFRELAQGYRLRPEWAKYFQPYQDLALVPSDVRPKPFRLAFQLGTDYDSNVSLQPQEWLYTHNIRKGSTHVDWAGRIGSRVEYFPVLQPNLNLGLRWYNFYQQHAWQDNWNWYDTRGDLFLTYQTGPLLWQPLVSYDYTLYSSERYSFIKTYGLNVDWPETSWLRGEITYRGIDKTFIYGVGDWYQQSGWENQVGFFQGIMLPGLGALRVGAAFERDLAQGKYVTSWTVRPSLQGVFFLPWQVTGWAQMEFAYTNFDNYAQWVQASRLDRLYQVQLLLKKPLGTRLSAWLGFAYVKNLSTMDGFKYSRVMVPILLSYDFF